MTLTVVSKIVEGTRFSDRVIGEDITNEDLWDCYIHVPGARQIINKPIEAIYHNGFSNFDVERERLDEIIRAHEFRDVLGVAALVFEGENIQAWNLKIHGIGFELTHFDKKGVCDEITIYNDPKLTTGIGIKVQKSNFILLRTPEGLAGPVGISKLIGLIDILPIQHKIWTEYLKYAEHQGLAHPVLKIKDLDETKYDRVNSAMSAPSKDDAVIIDAEDEFDYKSAFQSAYDPVPILEYGDTFVTRESQLNRLQWYGDPTGVLAASETATANWYAHIKEEQDRILAQIKPILYRLGAPEDVVFNDPGEYTLLSQMEGITQIRMALGGLVDDEQIIEIINKYLGLEGSEKLKIKKKEPEEKQFFGEDKEDKNIEKKENE
jgi:hypothetical protein